MATIANETLDDSKIQTLLSSAAHIGAETKVQIDSLASETKAAEEARGEAADKLRTLGRAAAGFDTPIFNALARVADVFATAQFVDNSGDLARSTAKRMAESFMSSCTGATDATKKGGTPGGYAHVIRQGKNATAILAALHGRIQHWQGIADAAESSNSPDKAATIALARRYTVVCGLACADESGAHPKNNKGETVTPKFNGRPSGTFRGVPIAFAGGTTRNAQLAAYTLLVESHGDVALHPDVIDAFLDNGGKYVENTDTVLTHATAARDAINRLLLLGGADSADATHLTLFLGVMERIRESGFKASNTAAGGSTQSTPSNPPPPAPPAPPTEASPTEASPTEASPTEASPTEGKGVVLGQPSVNTGPRPRRRGGMNVGA